MKHTMQGFYKFEAVNKDTNERRLVCDWFPNLITNIGLNQMGIANYLDFCMVGTGTTPPTIVDTTLNSQIASTTTLQSSNTYCATSSPYFGAYVKTFRFDVGTTAGNLSEVGIGWGTSTIKSCYSRALILDGSGNPTTITILANEFLDVTYELRCYAPLTDQAFSTVLDGVTYTGFIRSANVTNPSSWAPSGGKVVMSSSLYSATCYSGPAGAITSVPSGTTSIATLTVNDTYVNNSLTVTSSFTFGLSAANFGTGIKSISLPSSSIGIYQLEFATPIPKDNTKTFQIRFGVSWARR